VVTSLILLGRFLEARAKRKAGALRALLELGAKDVALLDPTAPSGALRALRHGDLFVVRLGKVATDGVVVEVPPRSTPRWSQASVPVRSPRATR
jgi:Cu+-exporting ATPase